MEGIVRTGRISKQPTIKSNQSNPPRRTIASSAVRRNANANRSMPRARPIATAPPPHQQNFEICISNDRVVAAHPRHTSSSYDRSLRSSHMNAPQMWPSPIYRPPPIRQTPQSHAGLSDRFAHQHQHQHRMIRKP